MQILEKTGKINCKQLSIFFKISLHNDKKLVSTLKYIGYFFFKLLTNGLLQRKYNLKVMIYYNQYIKIVI